MRYTATLTFDYKDARSAEAVEAALSVDAELSASVQRESRVDGASVVSSVMTHSMRVPSRDRVKCARSRNMTRARVTRRGTAANEEIDT